MVKKKPPKKENAVQLSRVQRVVEVNSRVTEPNLLRIYSGTRSFMLLDLKGMFKSLDFLGNGLVERLEFAAPTSSR